MITHGNSMITAVRNLVVLMLVIMVTSHLYGCGNILQFCLLKTYIYNWRKVGVLGTLRFFGEGTTNRWSLFSAIEHAIFEVITVCTFFA